MSNKALTPSNGGHGELAETDSVESFVVPGMEHVQPGELRIPLLKLVQAQSRMDGADDHPGQWHNSVTGEFDPGPELLIIGVAKGRVMFPATYNADNKPLCGSDDGAAPRAEYVGASLKVLGADEAGEPTITTTVIPKKCADCPFSQWGEGGEPPKCNEVATFAGMDKSGLPVLIQIRSTGLRNVPNLKTLIAANGIRKTIHLGSVKESGDTGVYFVPVFTVGAKPNSEWQAGAIRLARMGNLAARNQQAIIEYENRAEQDEPEFDGDDYEEAPDFEAEIPF
jgi:hypothetical protein